MHKIVAVALFYYVVLYALVASAPLNYANELDPLKRQVCNEGALCLVFCIECCDNALTDCGQ